MRSIHIFTGVGIVFGIVAIVFGIVAIVTSSWIKVVYTSDTNQNVTYDLFQRCGPVLSIIPDEIDCPSINSFSAPQGLEIAGLVILAVGVLVGVTRNIFIEKIDVYLVPLIFTTIGSILLLIGFLVYAKYVIEDFGVALQIKVNLGYSMILMVVSCILGFGLTAFFSFNAGYIRRNKQNIVVASG